MSNQEILNYLGSEEQWDPQAQGVLLPQNLKQAGKWRVSKGGKEGKISLRIRNYDAGKACLVELFNAVRPIFKYPNDAYYSDQSKTDYYATPFRPFSTESMYKALAVQSNDLVNGNYLADLSPSLKYKAVISDNDGSLMYVETPTPTFTAGADANKTLGQASPHNVHPINSLGALSPRATVQCNQFPYSLLLDKMNSLVLRVNEVHFQVSDQGQFRNDIFYKDLSTLGSDTSQSDNITISPMQNQDKVAVYKQPFLLTKNKALFWRIEPNQDIVATFFVTAFQDNAINSDFI